MIQDENFVVNPRRALDLIVKTIGWFVLAFIALISIVAIWPDSIAEKLVVGAPTSAVTPSASDQQRLTEILKGTAVAAARADAAYNEAMKYLEPAGRDEKTVEQIVARLRSGSLTIGKAVADIQALHHKTKSISNAEAREQVEFGMLRAREVYEEKRSFLADAASAIGIGNMVVAATVTEKHKQPLAEIQTKGIMVMAAFSMAKSTLGMPPELTEFNKGR